LVICWDLRKIRNIQHFCPLSALAKHHMESVPRHGSAGRSSLPRHFKQKNLGSWQGCFFLGSSALLDTVCPASQSSPAQSSPALPCRPAPLPQAVEAPSACIISSLLSLLCHLILATILVSHVVHHLQLRVVASAFIGNVVQRARSSSAPP
jgi:hypothetical protein